MSNKSFMERTTDKKIKILLTIVILVAIISIGLFYNNRINNSKVTNLKTTDEADITINPSSDADITINPSSFVGTDTEKIQSAIDSLTNGGTIIISKIYQVGELVSKDNINFIFTPQGRLDFTSGTTCLKLGNNNTLVNPQLKETRLFQNLPSTSYGISTNEKSNILITGKGCIEGFTFCNIAIIGGENITITRGIECKNAGSKSYDLTTKLPTSPTKKLSTNGFEGLGICITGGASKIDISAYCHDNGKHGIQSWASNSLAADEINIHDSVCVDNGDCGITLQNTTRFKVDSCKCNNNGINGGPYGGQGIQIVGTSSQIISDGSITNCTTNSNKENGIENIYYISNVIESNNISRFNTWNGIKLYQVRHANVSNNICNDNLNEGILIQSCDDVNSAGNTTNNNRYNGEKISSSTNTKVTNFTASNNGKGETQRSGVSIDGGRNNSVINGQASDNTIHPAWVSAAAYTLGNVIYSGTHVYLCVTAGTSGSTAPIHTNGTATDGTVTWRYVEEMRTATQQYGVRLYNVQGGLIANVTGSGNITKLIQIDGGSTGIILNNPIRSKK